MKGNDTGNDRSQEMTTAQHASNMYKEATTWNPFKGCRFDCTYCVPSFQMQAKRQMHNCTKCYKYEPHEHPERLRKIPNSEIVFVCGNGDLAFADPDYVRRIVEAISRHGKGQTFYLQSKSPGCFEPFLSILPKSVILVTTLETNRDEGYGKISKAPPPSERYRQFLALDYPRKVVTIEPVLQFDLDVFAGWISNLRPEYVWLGYNSRPKQVQMPEPSQEKLREFIGILSAHGIEMREKKLRGIRLPGSSGIKTK